MIDNQNILQCVNYHESEIVGAYPVSITNRNKRLVYDIAYPDGVSLSSQASQYMRWRGVDYIDLPDTDEMFPSEDWVKPVPGFYDYVPCPYPAKSEDWHVLFADAGLFKFYGGPLLAQDETMVAEHPVLGHLREYLITNRLPALTCEKDRPTPVTISNVPRRCSIDTTPSIDRPQGLYGHRFASASPDVIRSAVAPISPPTKTNIIAMASLPGGDGCYSQDDIGYLLKTAYTGFAAPRFLADDETSIIVHTGFWGCGAFGGNKTLMALIQIIAASMANVRLVFHYGDESDLAIVEEAIDNFDYNFRYMRQPGFIGSLWHYGFRWGSGNGT